MDRTGDFQRPGLLPPATVMSCPEMLRLSSEARKRTALAMSMGSLMRPSGPIMATEVGRGADSLSSGLSIWAAMRGDRFVAPGATALTLTLYGPSCVATDRVKATTPAFAAA